MQSSRSSQPVCEPCSVAVPRASTLARNAEDEDQLDPSPRWEAARVQILLDNLDGGVVVEDQAGNIELCNGEFCRLLNLQDAPSTLRGQSFAGLVRRISPLFFIPEAFEERIEERVRAGVLVRGELTYLADLRILEQDYAPLLVDGQLTGHLWAFRDVTVREKNQDLLQRQADELRALSLVDELTGLYNRRGFLTLATQQLKLCDRSMRPALVVFVDLDGMKRINDELGHEYGDQALVEVASVLRQSFRYSDVIGRLGGDEFVVLAVEAEPLSGSAIVQRLQEKAAEVNAKPDRRFQLAFSVGVTSYNPREPEMVEEVLARADSLMYEQKRARRAGRDP